MIRGMRRLLLPLVIPLVVAALAPAARAQSQNKAAAEAAFQKARQLKDAGQVEEACTEFRRSQDLDPQLGTQYNLALCFEELGRLASAWAEYKELAALDTNKKRKADSAIGSFRRAIGRR